MYNYQGFYKQLDKKNIKISTLTENPGISSTILAKFGKKEAVSFGTIKTLCDYFGCKMSDIVEYDGNKID